MVKNDNDRPLFSFAIVADTHLTTKENLSFDGSDSTGNKLAAMYDDLIARVNAMNPEFVVHLGDITDPVPVSPEFGDSAQAFHKASEVFSMPYYLVPGNHDVGEKIHPALPKINDEVSITKRAIDQYEQHFGQQRYSFEHGDCLFLVINTMLLNSGLEEEQEQWDWLVQVLSDNVGKRKFVFAHYPLYLSARDEPDYYDNIDEPARSRLIELLAQHPIEGYYAGHVHNFFYNYLNGMHQFVLPSTGIIRADYMEFFRTMPTREMGSFDPAKLGFFWVDVYADRHVPYLIRASDEHPYRTHSWNSTGSTVTVDLRIPWCDEVDIPTPWGLEIFERKHVRNDYPLAALWEMGIKDCRIPISDLLNPRVSDRVKQLSALGHRFTVVMFGLPNEERRAALADHSAGIKAIEVVALFDQWPEFAAPLKELRHGSGFEVYLLAVRPEVEGWTTHHGMHVDLTDEVDWVLSQPDLADAVDGFVFGIRRDMSPFDGYTAVRQCLFGTSYKPLLHVPCVGMYWSMASTDEVAEKNELARVAEATLLARANPDLSFVIDNFVELDRGYCSCWGLVDRLYNPKDGSRVATSLNTLLPQQLRDLTSQETTGGRVLSAECDDGMALLISPNSCPASSEFSDHFPDGIADRQGTLVDLVSGTEMATTLREVIAKRAGEETPQSPALLLLND
jgi:3',5'-cyclic AMP phosphodiesterase CpdA